MNRPTPPSLLHALTLAALLVAPLALMPSVNAADTVTIDAPMQAKKGLGLVLLVSLQRP